MIPRYQVYRKRIAADEADLERFRQFLDKAGHADESSP